MQTEEHRQIPPNARIALMIAVVVLAMGIPVASMVLAFRKATAPPRAADPGDSAPLREALQAVSEDRLAPQALETADRKLEIVADPAAERTRVAALAAAFGGTVLTTEETPEKMRLLAQLPEGNIEAFLTACRDRQPPPSEPPKIDGSRTVLVDIVIVPKAP